MCWIMIMCMSCYIVTTIMCCEYNCMCYVEVCSSKVGTTSECCIALLVTIRSGIIIVIVELLYAMHHIVYVCWKWWVMGLEVGTCDCLGFRGDDSVRMRNQSWVVEISNKPLMSKLVPHALSRFVSHIAYIKVMWIELLHYCIVG